MTKIADLVREGVPVLSAVRLVLSPPEWLEGRVRAGAAQALRPSLWTTGISGWEGVATPPPGVGLVGCTHCRCRNAVSLDLFERGAVIGCGGEDCPAVLTTDGTWVPEGTPPRAEWMFVPMR